MTKIYKHNITLRYEGIGEDGQYTEIVRVTDEDRNVEHLLDEAIAQYKRLVLRGV